MTKQKRASVVVIITIIVVFAWHLVLTIVETRDMQQTFSGGRLSGTKYSISINPLTDAVTFKVMMEPDEDPFSAVGAALAQALLPGTVEPMLNGVLSKYPPDPYAIVVPHHVRAVTEYPDAETMERMRSAREKAKDEALRQKEQAEAAKLEKVRAYVKDNLSIEKLKVGRGSHTGEPPYQETVEGAIVNHGKKSLKEVRVRFYFLNSEGGRIGDSLEYSPVLVTEYSFGDDAMPLRPGQRKNFGYLVGAKAPDEWAKKVEAEIVDFKFLEQKD